MTFLFILITSLWLHPFHASVTELRYRQGVGFEMETKLFTDDTELALKELYGKAVNLSEITDNNKKLLEKYLKEHLSLNSGKNTLPLTFVGYEIEKDAIWCYMECKYTKKLSKLVFKNSILLPTYQDQINIVNFKNGSKESNFKADYKVTELQLL